MAGQADVHGPVRVQLLTHMLQFVYESLLNGEQADDTISSLNAEVEDLPREEFTLQTILVQHQEEQGHSLQVDGEEGGEKRNKTALLSLTRLLSYAYIVYH